jgi:glyoxylase-like metal-dependent hydrolase (beta-lactamase superfamily II)
MSILKSAIVAFGLFLTAHAQPANDEIEVLRVRPNFYMLAGAGGNIAVQTGPDGAVLVDAGTLAAADRVVAAIKKLTDQPIRFIINTGPDADHVSGNGRLAKAGRSMFAMGTQPVGGEFARDMTNGFAASILAAENVLLRLSAPTGKASPLPSDTWPTETFSESRRSIYFNQEGIQIVRVPAAHSDADSIVFFRASDVIATGDILDANHFPVIDVEQGGSIQGELAALNKVIEMAVRPVPLVFAEGGTYILPGHGRIYGQPDVVEYRDMLVIIRDIIQDQIQRGMTLEQIKAAAPAKGYASQYGSADAFVTAVYQGLTKK